MLSAGDSAATTCQAFFSQINVKKIIGIEITGVILLVDETIFALAGGISSSISTQNHLELEMLPSSKYKCMQNLNSVIKCNYSLGEWSSQKYL